MRPERKVRQRHNEDTSTSNRVPARRVMVRERSRIRPTLRRMTNVKVRSFTTPGQTVELAAEATPNDEGVRVALTARFAGKAVATARVDFARGSTQ